MHVRPPAPRAGAFLVAALALLAHGAAHASCGSAFCAINTDLAADRLGLGEGSVLDLRYEVIRQDQPRTGTRKLAVGEIPHHHDEVRTTNRNLLASWSQNFASGWGYTLAAPLVDRDHLHIHNHHGEKVPEQWSFREFGDVRVLGRYRLQAGEDGTRTAGVTFGAKLPTGRTGIANAQGDVAERSLQPGTGSTDAIVGAFVHQQLPARDAAVFANVQLQSPVRASSAYRPGAQLAIDVGYSQQLGGGFSGLVQLNALAKRRDRGSEAEPADSGSRSLYLSPGLAWQATEQVRLYGFLQQPLRQDVRGVQLTAQRAVVVGLSTRF